MPVAVKPNLSRERIAETALAMTDSAGLDGLSMRKLGSELGVEAMSLYHYVDSKADLLDAVLDCLFGELELPTNLPECDWESALRLGLSSFRQVLIRHPAALQLFATRPAKSKVAFDVLGRSYKVFMAAGLDVAQSARAFHFAVSFVMGHVAVELGAMELEDSDTRARLAEVEDPLVTSMLSESMQITPDEHFEAGLDTIIAGLRASYQLA